MILGRTIGGAAALSVLGLLVFLGWAFHDFGTDKITDQTGNWPSYNRDRVSHYFKLPSELILVSAVHNQTAIMGERITVRFRLPLTKTPRKWLKEIAAESGFTRVYHEGEFLVGCRGCKSTYVQYDPKTQLYEAEGGWD